MGWLRPLLCMNRVTEERLRRQNGVVAVWQLIGDGCSEATIRHAVAGMRRLHQGVFVSGHAAPTAEQRRIAATLSSGGTVLSHASRAEHAEFFERRGRRNFETVTRFGRGGPEWKGSLLVYRSVRLGPDVVDCDGAPMMSNARTVLDLLRLLNAHRGARLVRDALRIGATTNAELRVLIARHRGTRGVAQLRTLVDEYTPLPISDTKSDAEAWALVLIQAARLDPRW